MNKGLILAELKDFREKLSIAMKAWRDERNDTIQIGLHTYKHPQYLQDRKDALMRLVDRVRAEGDEFVEKTYNELMQEAALASDKVYEPSVGELEVLKDISAQLASAKPEELNAIFARAQESIRQDTAQAWAFRTAILRAKGILKQSQFANETENTAHAWARWGQLVQQYDDKHDSGVEIRALAEDVKKQWKLEDIMNRPFASLSYMDRVLLKEHDPEGYRIASGMAE